MRYEFLCPSCGKRFDANVPTDPWPPLAPCECGGMAEKEFLPIARVFVPNPANYNPNFKHSWADQTGFDIAPDWEQKIHGGYNPPRKQQAHNPPRKHIL